ncbi:hypothetical protein DMJ13_02990 [halophilic archaeon]|nr:hypothetical protein DMJ13_02990 [halophilic archaeon]
MKGEVRVRLLAVVGLAVLAVALAVTGTALGIANPLTADEPGAQVTVTEDGITLSNGGPEETVVGNMTAVETVKIASHDGQLRIRTEEKEPLTSADRIRAIEVAQNNDTLQRSLDELSEYELEVQPIEKLDASTAETVDISGVTKDGPNDSEDPVFRVETNSSAETSESITIRREPSYVENQATIKIRRPTDDELLYSAEVNLSEGRIVDITDWTDVESRE